MKHISLFESYIKETQTQSQKLELPKELRKKYIEELGKHVTYPEIFKKMPHIWQVIVNYGQMTASEQELFGSGYTLKSLWMKASDVTVNVWGTPKAMFNKFVGHVANLDSDGDDEEFDYFMTKPDHEYLRIFGVNDPEIIRIMKSLYNNYEVVNWIKVK